jgi:excisionase family DNA binding protein
MRCRGSIAQVAADAAALAESSACSETNQAHRTLQTRATVRTYTPRKRVAMTSDTSASRRQPSDAAAARRGPRADRRRGRRPPLDSQQLELTVVDGRVDGPAAPKRPAVGQGRERHTSTPATDAHPHPPTRGVADAEADVRLNPLLLTVPEAAKVLHIGRRQAWEMVWREELPVVRLGRSVRIAQRILEAFVLERSRPYGA